MKFHIVRETQKMKKKKHEKQEFEDGLIDENGEDLKVDIADEELPF